MTILRHTEIVAFSIHTFSIVRHPEADMAKKKEKKDNEKKLTKRVNLRMTEKEFALVQQASDKDDRPLSNWARRALVHEARRQLGKKR